MKPDPRSCHYVYWGWALSAVIEVLAIVPKYVFFAFFQTKSLASDTMYIGISHTRARVKGLLSVRGSCFRRLYYLIHVHVIQYYIL